MEPTDHPLQWYGILLKLPAQYMQIEHIHSFPEFYQAIPWRLRGDCRPRSVEGHYHRQVYQWHWHHFPRKRWTHRNKVPVQSLACRVVGDRIFFQLKIISFYCFERVLGVIKTATMAHELIPDATEVFIIAVVTSHNIATEQVEICIQIK